MDPNLVIGFVAGVVVALAVGTAIAYRLGPEPIVVGEDEIELRKAVIIALSTGTAVIECGEGSRLRTLDPKTYSIVLESKRGS